MPEDAKKTKQKIYGDGNEEDNLRFQNEIQSWL